MALSRVSPPLKVLIVDDERLARVELRQALAEFPGRAHIVGEAANKREVLAYLAAPENKRPDAIFLDINMPKGSGFDVLEEIDYEGERPIQIVFVTAYDEYAVRAFTVNALDYILKPVDPDRLERTLDRLEKFRAAAHSGSEAVSATASEIGSETVSETGALETSPITPAPAPPNDSRENEHSSALTMDDFIFVAIGKTRRFTALSNIVRIASNDNYSDIWLSDGKRAMMLRTMNEWESLLPASDFVRIHRSAIINIRYIDETRPIEPNAGGGAYLYLQNESEPFAISRRYFAKLKEKTSVA